MGVAAEPLKRDKGVVMAAVAAHGLALQFASYELRDDPQVCWAAMASDIGCNMKHASARLQQDDMFVYIRQQLQDHLNMLVFTRPATSGATGGPMELSMELIEQIGAFVDAPPGGRLRDLRHVRDRLVEALATNPPPRRSKRLRAS